MTQRFSEANKVKKNRRKDEKVKGKESKVSDAKLPQKKGRFQNTLDIDPTGQSIANHRKTSRTTTVAELPQQSPRIREPEEGFINAHKH